MGGGSYSYIDSHARSRAYAAESIGVSASVLTSMSDETYAKTMEHTSASEYQRVFTARHLDPEMDIRGKVRESCDSTEHPCSFPIIIGLDVTGSMASIPGDLITQAFPEIMKSIMEAGVEHAQVCFVGIGDDIYDRAPIQVGQFETSDLLTEKWLKKIFLECGGGPNMGEAYGLCWYFAARHTTIDSYEKRGIKGCLITIGDEPVLSTYSRHSIEQLFGDSLQGDVDIKHLCDEVSEKWDVYHIHCSNEGVYRRVAGNWEDIMPQGRLLNAERNVNSISKCIISAILDAYPTLEKIGNTETPTAKTQPETQTDTTVIL